MIPAGTVHISKTVRSGYIISVLLAITLVLAIGPHSTATAFSVAVPDLSVKKTVEKIIPVSLQVKANLSVTLPPVVNTTPARSVINNLTAPLIPPASPVVQAADQAIPVATSSAVTLTTAPTPPAGTTKNSTAVSSKKQTSTVKSSDDEPTSLPVVLVPFGGADFLNVLFSSALQNSADHMAYKKADSSSILISAGSFLLSLTVVMGIIYTMLRQNIIPTGNGIVSQMIAQSTRTQVLILIVVVLSAELAGIFLALSFHGPSGY